MVRGRRDPVDRDRLLPKRKLLSLASEQQYGKEILKPAMTKIENVRIPSIYAKMT